MSQTLALIRFLILAVTIVGGLHGIVATFALFFGEESQGLLVVPLLLFMLTAYGYVTVAGLVFWRHSNRVRPLFWAQVIQVPWISLPGLVYKFAVGLTSSIAVVFTHAASEAADKYSAGFAAHWSLGSSWTVSLFRSAPLEIGVNVVPLAVLFLLRNARRLTNQPATAPPSIRGDTNGVTTLTQA